MNRRSLLSFGPIALIASVFGFKKSVEAAPIVQERIWHSPPVLKAEGPRNSTFALEFLAHTRDTIDFFMKAYVDLYMPGTFAMNPAARSYYVRGEIEPIENEFSGRTIEQTHLILERDFKRFVAAFYSHDTIEEGLQQLHKEFVEEKNPFFYSARSLISSGVNPDYLILDKGPRKSLSFEPNVIQVN